MNYLLLSYRYSTKEIMFFVLLACVPGIITKCYFFGINVIIEIIFSVIIALLMELLVLKIRYKNIKETMQDNSAILTAVLFSLSLPPEISWWIICLGLFFSIVIAKHLYGGIGQNIFNPAMIGYLVLLISFPIDMNNWHEKKDSFQFSQDVKYAFYSIFNSDYRYNLHHNANKNIRPNAFTEATPLNKFKIVSHDFQHSLLKDEMFLKKSWFFINFSFLLGGIFLLYMRIICWRIPISVISVLILLSCISWFYMNNVFLSPFVHIFSGSTMIGAFFIATDPVTTAYTNLGKIVFGMIIGILIWIIRHYTDYPDSIAFSVLFANMLVPLIDYLIKNDGYGRNIQ